jgi:long-chain acyl-CoA synthetase
LINPVGQLSLLVHRFLEISAASLPDKKALFSSGHWQTYREVNEQANALAHLLIGRGICRGDRIAFLLENSAEYVITYYAIMKAGGITVALNTDNTATDIEFILRDCQVRCFVTSPKFLSKTTQLSRDRRCPVDYLLWSDASHAGIDRPWPEALPLPEASRKESRLNPSVPLIDLDIASIVYTSGSTGKPRGVTLSHLNIVANTRSIVEYLGLSPADRIMVVLPFHYIYGKSLLNTHFFIGGSVVVDNRFMYPAAVLQTMKDQAVTGFAGVPSTFAILLSRAQPQAHKLPALRYITQAGGAMPPVLQKKVAETFAPAKLFVMYGATEASARLSYLNPKDLPQKWGSIGKAIPNVELFIADEHGHRLGPGKEGEIVARGSNIMLGYWGQPEESRKALRNGLFFTGDIGVMDEEGFLFIIGRNSDMIKVGGNRVSTKEIEDVLFEHPAVCEVAVIGVQDALLGEVPKAFVVLKPDSRGESEDAFRAFLSEHLAAFKVPQTVLFCDSLPKNDAGKVLKAKLG